MSRADEASYWRMHLLVLNVCPITLRHVIDDYALRHAGSLSLCDFLEKSKDRLFHLYKRECCCGHKSNRTPMYKMYQPQWDSLFNRNTSTCLNGKRIDCPCKYDGKAGITTNDMNLLLCCLVIMNICPGVDINHIKTIREIHNNLIHADRASLDLLTNNGYFNRVKTAICELAKNVSTSLHTDTVCMIDELENGVMDPFEMCKVCHLETNKILFTDMESLAEVIQIPASEETEKVTQIEEGTQKTMSRVSDMEMKTVEMKKFLRDGVISVQHARGIIVGCAGAGKTTLLKRLQGASIHGIEGIDSTRGLEVHFHAFEIKDGRLEGCEHEIEKTSFLSVAASELKSESEKRNPSKQSDHVLPDRSLSELKTESVTEFDSKSELETEFESFSGNTIHGKTTTKKEAENTSQDQSASGISDDQIRKILSEKEKSFKITMVDIAGQLAYYACHQTYFTDKGFYVLVLDMTKTFDTPVEQEEKSGRDSIFAKWTYKEYLRFWIDSIKTFGNKRAPVFLVATHCEGKTKNEINRYFEEVFDLVKEDKKWLKRIVGGRKFAFALKDFSYDSKKKIDEMKQMMVEVATKELDSSLKVRASWALVEDFLRNSNKKMISRSEIWQMKEKIGSNYHFADEDEMETFLSFFHDHGFLLYFNEMHLKEYVVLDIQWFVNAFSIIIADKTHFESDNSDNTVKQWEQFNKTGMLTNDLLKKLWEKDEILLEHQEAILSYMERLRIITVVDGDWYVPCMNKKHDTSNELESYTISCSVLSRKYAIFLYFRLIAYCISVFRWRVLLDKNSLKQLYQTATCFADNNCCFAIRISNENINVNFKQAESDHTKEKFLSAIKDALTEITETFFPHGSDEDPENKSSSMEEKETTSFHFKRKGKPDFKGDKEKQSSARDFKREIQKLESSKESPGWTEDNLANLIHEIESSLKTGHITDELRSLLNNNQEMMSLPSSEKSQVREKLEGIVTNHFKRNLSSDQFSVTLAVRDNSFHFVVICEDHTFKTKADQNWITFVMVNDAKMESIDVIPQRMRNPPSDIDKKKLEEFMNTECHSSLRNTLFEEHSNLNSVSFTKGKSINYGSRDWIITDEMCVVLQCFHKGYIPFGESPFPSKIGNYRTDVREGHCSLSAGPKVQMGKSVYSESIQLKSCLGNFVQNEDGSTAFITCAHVIFPVHNLRKISSLNNYRGTAVYDTETRQKIGHVTALQFHCNIDESVDTALVVLDQNTKIEPGFPTINMDQMQHAGFLLQPFCISSTVLKIDNNNRKCYVVKYGPETHLTVGTLELGIISCKPFHWDITENIPTSSRDNKSLIMCNQILINPCEKDFLQQGDSGSFVFMVDDQEKALKCIGMLIGQTSSGQGIMTPIHRILEKLNITNGLKSFPQRVQLQTTFSNPMMEMFSRLQESMNSLHEKVDGIDNKFNVLDRRVRSLESESQQNKTKEMDCE